MELRHLRYFLAVAETLNFARAAEQLHIDPSPLSRAIQQLEAEIGGQLFTRDTRKVTLTALGMALVPRAERSIAEVDALAHEMHERARGRADVSLGFRSVPHDLLRRVTESIAGPVDEGISVQLRPLVSQTQIRSILSGELDLGIVQSAVEHRNLSSIPLLVETQGLAMPARDYANLEVASIETLADLTLLVPAGTDMSHPNMGRFGATARDVVAVEFDIVGGFAALVANGGYCCFVPLHEDAPWHRYVAVPGVVVKPFDQLPPLTTSLVWKSLREHEMDLGPIVERVRADFLAPLQR